MFSGIVEEAATVTAIREQAGNIDITMRCSFADELHIDQSVAHNGVCLTVVSLGDDNTYTVTAIADRCALPDFRVVLTKRQTALRQKLLDSYRKSGREVPFVDDIYASFPTNERDDCKKVLENLVSCGELVMLTPQLFYHKDVYEEVCALTRDFFEGHPAFTLAEYRDLLGTSRKYALAILEFFDKTKVTKMVGDHREVIGSL